MKPPLPSTTFDLNHGIRLAISNPTSHLTISSVADFLSQAITHFKEQQRVRTTDTPIAEPYAQTIREGGKVVGLCSLSSDHRLTADLWTDAVIEAYSRANTVEHMLENVTAYKTTTQGASMSGAIAQLEKPNGDLLAFGEMLKR